MSFVTHADFSRVLDLQIFQCLEVFFRQLRTIVLAIDRIGKEIEVLHRFPRQILLRRNFFLPYAFHCPSMNRQRPRKRLD